jgi:hypothetical protein
VPSPRDYTETHAANIDETADGSGKKSSRKKPTPKQLPVPDFQLNPTWTKVVFHYEA